MATCRMVTFLVGSHLSDSSWLVRGSSNRSLVITAKRLATQLVRQPGYTAQIDQHHSALFSLHYAVLAAGHIWLLSSAASDYEWGRNPLLSHTETQLEPHQHLPCKFIFHYFMLSARQVACFVHLVGLHFKPEH